VIPWLLPLAVACGAASPLPVEAVQGPPVQDAVLRIGHDQDLVVQLAGAWVDGDGDGHGQGARATAPGAPPLTISSKTSSWSLRDGTMVFEGDVAAVRGPVTLTCDRLDVTYAGERV